MCSIFSVSKSAYYRWLINPVSKREIRNHELDDEIYAIFHKHKKRYGGKRIYEEMKDKGWKVTEEKVLERMKLMNLIAKANKQFIKTTDTQHNQYVVANRLKQDFKACKPNEKWVTDITYIPTEEGFLYLCVFLDLYSRAIVGWSMADHMRSELVNNALTMAMFKRSMPTNVLVHSDKGAQYTSESFHSKLIDYKLVPSMSGTGCCYDNAACESFFGTLKTELCDDEDYQTIEEAKSSIFEYIEGYYNTQRKHSSINYFTPREFEDRMKNEMTNRPKLTG